MDKKRKAVIAGFIIFLLVMGICSLVTKGIYTAGLPQVTVTSPKEMSLYHPVSVVGAVETGQEYGVYAPAGLRVAAISCQKGDSFQTGDPLLQMDVEDLERILAEKELERQRQLLLQRERESQSELSRQEGAQTLTRALEDYERARRTGELQTNRAGGEYLRAQAALEELRKELEQVRNNLEQAQKIWRRPGRRPPKGSRTQEGRFKGSRTPVGPEMARQRVECTRSAAGTMQDRRRTYLPSASSVWNWKRQSVSCRPR